MDHPPRLDDIEPIFFNALGGPAQLQALGTSAEANDYLRVAARALLGWAWVTITATIVTEAASPDASRWIAPAAGLQHWFLPEFDMRVGIIGRRVPDNCTAFTLAS